MKKFHSRNGGFTLIELMIVVAIIGILAAIAIPNFLRFQLKAKSSEGKTNLAAIRTAEQSYYSEFGVFVSANPDPPTLARSSKTNFTILNTGQGFDQLGWSPEGQVYFNYAVNTAVSGYTATAGADIDADNIPQTWGYKKTDAATGNPVAPKDLGDGGACPLYASQLQEQVVGPCDPSFGQSVF